MQNVEFKAELRDLALARMLATSVGARFVEHLWQTDTYYKLADGRLKKRVTEGHPTEYIFYHRENSSRPRLSKFNIYTESEALARFGSLDIPAWVLVRKAREVYMHANTRIHLDMVDRLGMFIEFEAMVSPSCNLAKCYASVDRLRRDLGPAIGEPVATSYSDLLAKEIESPTVIGGDDDSIVH